ncbi:hypothetical protein BKA83DRAFT_4464457 [Pisolithus microcarpus]|nr:hypothetical protein BKA83DRAFT_4464457 [Pisolithus microcarpus]
MIPCMKTGCHCWFRNRSSLTQHMNMYHLVLPPINVSVLTEQCQASLPDEEEYQFLLDDDDHGGNPPPNSPNMNPLAEFVGPGDKYYQNYHPHLTGHPCDSPGHFLPTSQSPEPLTEKQPGDWSPYSSHMEFELANFLFTCSQMSAANINELLSLWNAALSGTHGQPIFRDSTEMYKTIDSTPLGNVKWENFHTSYTGEQLTKNVPLWMNDIYNIWFQDPKEVVHNILSQPDFLDNDFMSGNWAWKQVDIISHDPTMHGSTFIPIILGSDKTTVSVATSQNNYYPLYLSIGNIRNKVHHAHHDGVVLITFLVIPHTDKEHLFHASLVYILHNLKPAMSKPVVMQFGDRHYHHVVFSLGPYIADYEEQVLLACIVRGWCVKCLAMKQELEGDALYRSCEHVEVLIEEFDLKNLWDEYGIVGNLIVSFFQCQPFTSSFPCADIYELISPDILHQIIKGTFKDHLVEWVESYLKSMHGTTQANEILDDIDQQIATIAPFTGLRHFPKGHHFKQWTSNDSKVYLPAIEGHIPTGIVQAFHALLEFTYLVHRNVITEETLVVIQDTINCFHEHREIFCQLGTIQTFSLPRQHAMKHYPDLIHLFGAPNGLCTLITELKHINAVKDPYWQTNHNKPLGQMLVINQCLDKLAASRRDFNRENGDTPRTLGSSPHDEDADEAVDSPVSIKAHVELAHATHMTVTDLTVELGLEHLPTIVEEFLLQQQNPDDCHGLDEVPLSECPTYGNKIAVINSAAALFYVPSDISGISGMQCEYICSCHLWQNGPPQYDCLKGMRSLDVVTCYPFRDEPDADTGMWIICPVFTTHHCPSIAVIHVDTIYHTAHLILLYATQPVSHTKVPQSIKPHHSYDVFTTFYVNKFINHHAFSLLSDSY